MANPKYTKIVTRNRPGSYEKLYTNGQDSTIVGPGGLPVISNEYKKLYGGPVLITSDKPISLISQQDFNAVAEKFKPTYDNYYKAQDGNLIDKIKFTLSKLYNKKAAL